MFLERVEREDGGEGYIYIIGIYSGEEGRRVEKESQNNEFIGSN